MARIGHQVHRGPWTAQPGAEYGQQVAHAYHPLKAVAVAGQPQQAAQQVGPLALPDFPQLTRQRLNQSKNGEQ